MHRSKLPAGARNARALRLLSSSLVLAGIMAGAPSLAAQTPHQHSTHDLGTVDFRVSCAEAVRGDFDRGLGMLHHMMYPEARAIFQQIAERDPRCGMAHWGIAMTRFQPLWQRPAADAVGDGWAALQRGRQAGIRSERERALVTATEAFFRNPDADEWFPRLDRWAQAMERAHRAHPNDNDIAALYALSVIAAGQAPGQDRVARNATAARVLLAVHERTPDHPGALHYTIHANDITGRESKSLEIVRSYDDVAPSMPHALHMPTHIFVRLGAWPEVIEWNRKSADAALNFPAGDRLSMHHIHALDYMLYAHLQRGEDEKAKAVLDEAMGQGQYEGLLGSAFHKAVMPARYAVERRAWEEARKIEPRAQEYLPWDRYPWAESLSWFARGLGAAHSGDIDAAREAESRMQALRERATAAGTTDMATYIEVDRLILAGTMEQAAGRPDSAVALMRSAAALDGTVQKHPVTPGALLPPNEALGDLLMSLERPADALTAFEASLQSWPGRYQSMLGAARAARAAGNEEKARQHYAALLEITASESVRTGVSEARSFLTAQR